MPDVLSKEPLFIAIVQRVGLASFAMFSKCHVRLLHKTEVCPAPNFARMEGTAETQTMEQTVMNVSVPLGFKAAIVKKR